MLRTDGSRMSQMSRLSSCIAFKHPRNNAVCWGRGSTRNEGFVQRLESSRNSANVGWMMRMLTVEASDSGTIRTE